MANEQLKEALKEAAVELAHAEAEYHKAKVKFDNVFSAVLDNRNGAVKGPVNPSLPLHDANGKKPLTKRVLEVLPKDYRPLSIKQIAALVGAGTRVVSATCSNLRKEGKVESAGRGVWKLKQ